MATSGKKVQEIILSKLNNIEKEVKEVRQTDIPNLAIDIAVVKEKSSSTAKLITLVGGALTLVVSTAIAWFK